MEDRLAQRKRNFPRLCPPQKNRNIREIYDIIRTRLLCGSFSTFRRWRKKVARNTRGGAERSLSRSLSVPMAKLGEEVPLGRQKKMICCFTRNDENPRLNQWLWPFSSKRNGFVCRPWGFSLFCPLGVHSMESMESIHK